MNTFLSAVPAQYLYPIILLINRNLSFNRLVLDLLCGVMLVCACCVLVCVCVCTPLHARRMRLSMIIIIMADYTD